MDNLINGETEVRRHRGRWFARRALGSDLFQPGYALLQLDASCTERDAVQMALFKADWIDLDGFRCTTADEALRHATTAAQMAIDFESPPEQPSTHGGHCIRG